MQVVYPRCCGLDIHKKTIVACVLLTDPDGTLHRFVRTFGTMTADLLVLDDWLSFHAVTHVAMESTGVLWRPIYNVRGVRGAHSCWSTPNTSKRCQATKRTSRTANGPLACCAMGSCVPVSSPRTRSAFCGI
jgi:hypothetical protein